MEHIKKVEQDEITDGSRRARNTVQYDDGMTEEQWLKVRARDCAYELPLRSLTCTFCRAWRKKMTILEADLEVEEVGLESRWLI